MQMSIKAVLSRAWPILSPAFLFLIPLASPTPQHLQWATMGALWGLWVLSLNIVWGYAGQLSLAQIALGAVGAYGFIILQTQLGVPAGLAMLAGIGLAVLASLILSIAALRLSGFYFTILTVTFALVIITIITNSETAGRTTGLLASRAQLPIADLQQRRLDRGADVLGDRAPGAEPAARRRVDGAGYVALQPDPLAAAADLGLLHVGHRSEVRSQR